MLMKIGRILHSNAFFDSDIENDKKVLYYSLGVGNR